MTSSKPDPPSYDETLPTTEEVGNSSASTARTFQLPQPPPQYTGTTLVPTQALYSQSKRFYFIPPGMISAISTDRRIYSANKTQIKEVEFFVPEGVPLSRFHETYVPFFIKLPVTHWNVTGSHNGVHIPFPKGSLLLVNPHRIVEVYVNSAQKDTLLDVERDKGGKNDSTDGKTVIQFRIPLPIGRVLRLIDPIGVEVMKFDIGDRDLGFGQKLL